VDEGFPVNGLHPCGDFSGIQPEAERALPLIDAGDISVFGQNYPVVPGMAGIGGASQECKANLIIRAVGTVKAFVDAGHGEIPFFIQRSGPFLGDGFAAFSGQILYAVHRLPAIGIDVPMKGDRQFQHAVLFIPVDDNFDFHFRALFGKLISLAEEGIAIAEKGFNHAASGAVLDHADRSKPFRLTAGIAGRTSRRKKGKSTDNRTVSVLQHSPGIGVIPKNNG